MALRRRWENTAERTAFEPDSMNLIGLQTSEPSQTDLNGKWFEAFPPNQLHPADLHAAQLDRRFRIRTRP